MAWIDFALSIIKHKYQNWNYYLIFYIFKLPLPGHDPGPETRSESNIFDMKFFFSQQPWVLKEKEKKLHPNVFEQFNWQFRPEVMLL